MQVLKVILAFLSLSHSIAFAFPVIMKDEISGRQVQAEWEPTGPDTAQLIRSGKPPAELQGLRVREMNDYIANQKNPEAVFIAMREDALRTFQIKPGSLPVVNTSESRKRGTNQFDTLGIEFEGGYWKLPSGTLDKKPVFIPSKVEMADTRLHLFNSTPAYKPSAAVGITGPDGTFHPLRVVGWRNGNALVIDELVFQVARDQFIGPKHSAGMRRHSVYEFPSHLLVFGGTKKIKADTMERDAATMDYFRPWFVGSIDTFDHTLSDLTISDQISAQLYGEKKRFGTMSGTPSFTFPRYPTSSIFSLSNVTESIRRAWVWCRNFRRGG